MLADGVAPVTPEPLAGPAKQISDTSPKVGASMQVAY